MTVTWKGRLTDHFTLAEFTIGNSSTASISITKEAMLQALMMEEFRQLIGYPITVTSWFRTAAYNKKVGGVSTSNHLTGRATDWHTSFAITEQIAVIFMKIWDFVCKKHGVVGEAGLYTWGMHLGYQTPDQVKANKGKFFSWDSRSGKQKNWAFDI